MKTYTVEFVEQRSLTEMIEIADAYKFCPTGKFIWLQKLAWKFLNWRHAMQQAREPTVTVTRHLIDADTFIDRLIKQKRALLDGFNRDGQHLVIGSETYAELMNSPDITPYHFGFNAESDLVEISLD